MPNISYQSKSFIILFLIAVLGTFICLDLLSGAYDSSYLNTNQEYVNYDANVSALKAKAVATHIQPEVDTSSWKTFSSKDFNFSFKYNPSWKVLPTVKKSGYNIIQIDPGKKFFNIKIYISTQDYYVIAGLPFVSETIDGQTAMDVSDLLYGIKANNYYYTFDNGFSTSLKPDFRAMVHSAKFTIN